ncbi:hypothetical protein BO94DRAFT_598934 [Aspergillus sclerotioniger CBS 115572]|uniref:Zn(2)-C6 fungal-type domain-containing protein n=1 Tax=Aspergillus sclerotioniger CBS 115572 TaxID=1450535 RepID=A0A317WB24_9EURO|nr:hypothetical protein BO94DRAFT_598934 [Aspergillus sclerotioniger CBS 115572]PWY83696.1 hypothetical protein BO94DRAFT_598934 [Aspergillus sclerotioniger CBS 115572]
MAPNPEHSEPSPALRPKLHNPDPRATYYPSGALAACDPPVTHPLRVCTYKRCDLCRLRRWGCVRPSLISPGPCSACHQAGVECVYGDIPAATPSMTDPPPLRSCDRCRGKKVRCVRRELFNPEPCSSCIREGVPCVTTQQVKPPRRCRKKGKVEESNGDGLVALARDACDCMEDA